MAYTAAIEATGWAPQTMAGAERAYIRSLPLLLRPNRPGHFYGNTVRYLHYRNMAQGFHGMHPGY